MNALDLKTRSGKKIVDIAMAPLLDRDIECLLVDAGARGGMHDLPASYAAHIHMIGFEPNPDEYNKLVSRKTDAQLEGLIAPLWKKESFKDLALWDSQETRPIYIFNHTGNVTLMGEFVPSISQNLYSGFSRGQGGGGGKVLTALADICKLLSVEHIKCDTLDNVIGTEGKIDFLKVDVEGAEARLFKGAENLLKEDRILFVKTEFACPPLYEESGSLPGPQLGLLYEHGFRLLDFGSRMSEYVRCRSDIPEAVDRRLAYSGDMFLAVDPDRVDLSDTDLQRLGLISIAHGFRSFGLSVMRDAKLLSSHELADIEEALSRVRLRRKLRRSWEQFPSSFARLLYTQLQKIKTLRK
jgi:FkbM family methyltransferase